MRTSASRIAHTALGLGASAECEDVSDFACWVCGSAAQRGMPVRAWMGANFTGQDRARAIDSTHVCESCVLVMAGRPPDTLRMYSVLVDERGAHKLNKGAKPSIRAWLREPHVGAWFAAISDSGQKHIIPWAPINRSDASPLVAFEDVIVEIGDWTLVEHIATLLTMGATKEELLSGLLGARAWQLCGSALREFERDYGHHLRGGGWFALAVWLAQRDEEKVKNRLEQEHVERERKRKATHVDRGGASRGAKRVPRNEPLQRAQALGPDPGPATHRKQNNIECGRMGHESPASAQVGFAFAAPERFDRDAGKRGTRG